MKITDKRIIAALKAGEIIKRREWTGWPSSYVKLGACKVAWLLYYDNRINKWKSTSLSIYELAASDWEVIK